MLLDYELGSIRSTSYELKDKYKQAVDINRKLVTVFNYKDVWMSSLQDVCPECYLGGMTRIRSKNKTVELPIYIKDLLTTYWDSFLINTYKSLKKGTLEVIYSRLETLFDRMRVSGLSSYEAA